jgi:hypothetical protein
MRKQLPRGRRPGWGRKAMRNHLAATVVMVLVGGCGKETAPPAPDAGPTADAGRAPDSAGRTPDSNTGGPPIDGAIDRPVVDVGTSPDGAGTPDRPATDLGSADRGDGDRPAADGATGGPGCGPGSLCASLRSSYAEAVLRAQRCDTGAQAPCGKKARGALGCDPCEVWVEDTAELTPLQAQFTAADCGRCFYGSPTGDRCHPVGCVELDAPLCRASTGGGTCVNQPRDRTCPAGVMTGTACAPPDDYCTGGGRVCTCQQAQQRWSCF